MGTRSNKKLPSDPPYYRAWGVGKSKFAAECCRTLIDRYGWVGGLLPRVFEKSIFRGGKNGTLVIIDYPEEREAEIKEIIATAHESTPTRHPIRIILVSRNDQVAWRRICNLPEIQNFSEMNLYDSSELKISDSVRLIHDAIDTLNERIDRPQQSVSGIEEWLSEESSNRVPLVALAAAVHSVLEPEHAFSISGREVPLALAKIELRRTRAFSTDYLQDFSSLEKLLALSTLTMEGVSEAQILKLGDVGISTYGTGAEVLHGVKQTPYWARSRDKKYYFLEQIKPHRFAAAFFFLAFDPLEHNTDLPSFLYRILENGRESHGYYLDRLSEDLRYIDDNASKSLIYEAIGMLDLNKRTPFKLQKIATITCKGEAARFVEALNRKLLLFYSGISRGAGNLMWEIGVKSGITSNMMEQERPNEALFEARKSVALVRKAVKKYKPDGHESKHWVFGINGAINGITAINTLSLILRRCDELSEAYMLSLEALHLAKLFHNQSTVKSPSVLVGVLHNLAIIQLGYKRDAVTAFRTCQEALTICDEPMCKKSSDLDVYRREILKLSKVIRDGLSDDDISLRSGLLQTGIFRLRIDCDARPIVLKHSIEKQITHDRAANFETNLARGTY